MPNRRVAAATVPVSKSKLSLFPRLSANTSMVVLLLAFVSVMPSAAQETPKPTGPPDAPSAAQPAKSPTQLPGASLYNLLQKKSLVFPDIAASTEPLSPGQKFQLFVDNSISVHTILWSGITSAIGQADNSPTGFGQGWDAYGKRFGSGMARTASSQFFGTFMLASALHQDPRFFPEINPSFGRSVAHSVRRLFVTRNDSGQSVANISGLTGPLLAEGLANVYWPDRNRTVGDTFMRYGWDLASRAGGNVVREYWPVFYKKLHHAGSSAAQH